MPPTNHSSQARGRILASKALSTVLKLTGRPVSGTNLSPLGLIAEFESANGAQLQNTASTASGDWQMVNATWQEALTAVGGNPSQYPTAISAPVSLQAQAAAYEFNTYGWATWSSNAKLMAAVQAAGGTSAFASPGTLATDNASYAALDSGTDPLSFFGGTTGGGSGITVTATGTGATAPAAASSGTFEPYSWVWNSYQTTVQSTLTNDTGYVLQMAAQPLGMFLVLDMAIVGVLIAVGMNNLNNLWRRFFKILVVLGLIGAANIYQSDFVAVVTSLPTWLGRGLGLTGVSSSPAGNFDQVFWTFFNDVHLAWQQVPWGTEMFLDAGLLVIAGIIILGAEVVMFGVWFIAQVITEILLVIGPLLVLTLLSEYLIEIFVKYIKTLLLMTVITFVADLITALALQIMIAAFGAISQAVTAMMMVTGIVGVAIAIAAISAAVFILPRILEHLAGAAGVPSMATASNALRVAVSRIPGVGSGATSSARNIGSSSSTAFAPMRSVTPAGRSLSR
jgi:hypothetical protein